MRMLRVDQKALRSGIRDSAAVVASLERQLVRLTQIGEAVVDTLRAGRKILTAGNGGSAAEAMHFSEELVGRFRTNRVSLPSVALVADGTALTCIGNDFGFDRLFSRQIEGLGVAGDMLILFSTSGNGRNLLRGLKTARARDMHVVCLLGRDGGKLAGKADWELIVRSQKTERIQEAHQVILHLVLDIVEREFAGEET